jgi:hypothetical protein
VSLVSSPEVDVKLVYLAFVGKTYERINSVFLVPADIQVQLDNIHIMS